MKIEINEASKSEDNCENNIYIALLNESAAIDDNSINCDFIINNCTGAFARGTFQNPDQVSSIRVVQYFLPPVNDSNEKRLVTIKLFLSDDLLSDDDASRLLKKFELKKKEDT
jgi:hypothetical protein